MQAPLLSIAIPAYNRPETLLFSLERFVSQIQGRYEKDIEIVISDDCTPNGSLDVVKDFCTEHSFITFISHSKNIGLEQNLIECSKPCKGEYLWIFGDDDFLETDDSIEIIIRHLKRNGYDFYILNRSRRNPDLTKLLHENWMKLNPEKNHSYKGLRDFCIREGFISIIGFVSANIFRRIPYELTDHTPYMGTMYPQLGRMVEAFHDKSVLLISKPLICHRTPSQKEKEKEHGKKEKEADFMKDYQRRNAIYFSHPFTSMLLILETKNAFSFKDIVRIPERTVINGKLIDFLINAVILNHKMDLLSPSGCWSKTRTFFQRTPLRKDQKEQICPILSERTQKPMPQTHSFTISVITPSYNQAEFLHDCLASVKNQTYSPIEHLVFDPGSTDGSQNIAKEFDHVTLFEEPDRGQSDAVNKGFSRVSGEIVAWLNSDDQYYDDSVFAKVADRFNQQDQPDIVYGTGEYVDEKDVKLRDAYINKESGTLNSRFQHEVGIMQPATFIHRRVFKKIGNLRSNRHFTMDYDFWIRCVKGGIKFAFIEVPLAKARYHDKNKTKGQRKKSYLEICDLMQEHFGCVHEVWLKRFAEYLSEGHDGVLKNGANCGITHKQDYNRILDKLRRRYNS